MEPAIGVAVRDGAHECTRCINVAVVEWMQSASSSSPVVEVAQVSSEPRQTGGRSTQLMATTLCQMGGSCAVVLGPGGTLTQSRVPTESVQFVNHFVHLPCAVQDTHTQPFTHCKRVGRGG